MIDQVIIKQICPFRYLRFSRLQLLDVRVTSTLLFSSKDKSFFVFFAKSEIAENYQTEIYVDYLKVLQALLPVDMSNFNQRKY